MRDKGIQLNQARQPPRHQLSHARDDQPGIAVTDQVHLAQVFVFEDLPQVLDV